MMSSKQEGFFLKKAEQPFLKEQEEKPVGVENGILPVKRASTPSDKMTRRGLVRETPFPHFRDDEKFPRFVDDAKKVSLSKIILFRTRTRTK